MVDDYMTEITYHKGIFDKVMEQPYVDRWDDEGFVHIMDAFGYEMDSKHSFNDYITHSALTVKESKNGREQKRNDLYYLEHAPRQIVGNYLLSHWRYLTHWTLGYDNEYEHDFLCRIIAILEEKYDEE